MAKQRVGVLEAHEASNSADPQIFCGAAIARYLIEYRYARRIGKRLIQMISMQAKEGIKRAKLVRDHALVKVRTSSAGGGFIDGPLGVGNVLPFSKARSHGDKLHYWIGPPQHSLRFHGLSRQKNEANKSVLRSKQVKVSHRLSWEVRAITAINHRLHFDGSVSTASAAS